MRLVTEDEARLAQIEHAKALTREIERLEQLARTNRVALEWTRDQQARWKAERDAALKSERWAWVFVFLSIAVSLFLLVALAVVTRSR
jgi:hypothetical protein